jgi:DUF1009 family protein
MTRTALIAGRGGLPKALAGALAERPLIAAPVRFLPDGLSPDMTFQVERLVPFLHALEDAGVSRVVFAGAVQRPRLDPSQFDPETATLVPRLLEAMRGGDDATLRVVVAIFEEFGFAVAGVQDMAPDMVPGQGVLSGTVSAQDEQDATRAAAIVAALGSVDVGQGAVVQQGLCLAVETLSGTDAMLGAISGLAAGLRPDSSKGRGVFYKAPKPDQDKRIDLPMIGPETLNAVAAAGLGGIVWEAGGVICLDLAEMQGMAARMGLFLWARSP